VHPHLHRRKREEPHPNHERWLVSYADFITLLFAFFTTLYAMSVVDAEKAERLVYSIQQSFGTMPVGGPQVIQELPTSFPGDTSAPADEQRLDELSERLLEVERATGFQNGMNVRETEEGLVISLADSLFFTSGGTELGPESLPELRRVAKLVAELPNHVRVEGHTDDRPAAGGRYASNWHLSALRAVEVVRVFEQEGIATHRLSAAGFGDQRPLVSNDTEEGRGINRRVDVVVLRSKLPSGVL
jgi:chemotaxis protein MotB